MDDILVRSLMQRGGGRRPSRNQMMTNAGIGMAQSQQPVRGWGDAVANLANSLGGAFMAYKGMSGAEQDQAGLAKMLSDFSSTPGGGDPKALAAMLSGSDNPEAQDMGTKLLAQTLMGGSESPETFHSPMTVAGPGGRSMLVQTGNRGTVRPIEGYAPMEKPDPQKWMNLGGGVLFDPLSGNKQIVDEAYQRDLEAKRAGAPSVNVDAKSIYNAEEGAGMKEMFGELGKGIAGQQSKAQTAADTANAINALNSELEGVPTGTGGRLRTQALKGLDAIGLAGPETEAEIAKRETGQRLSGELVMQQLNAMKGPATEREREYLETMTPGLITTPSGRQAMAYVAQHQAAREAAKADAQAEIANAVQRRELPIGDAQVLLRQRSSEIDREFNSRFKPPTAGGRSASPTAAGGQAAPKKSSSLKEAWDSFK